MAVIACPGCGKQYKVAETAAGQVAKCACGKKFRLGSAQPSSATNKASSPPPKQAAAVERVKTPSVANTATDDFWDDTLAVAEPPKAVAPPANAPAPVGPTTAAAGPSRAYQTPAGIKAAEPPKKKKAKKERRVRWGADWGKVAGGLLTFLICGGICAAMFSASGRIPLYIAGVGIVGLFTALSGLMGEEGIW
jgi:hypothetical protein